MCVRARVFCLTKIRHGSSICKRISRYGFARRFLKNRRRPSPYRRNGFVLYDRRRHVSRADRLLLIHNVELLIIATRYLIIGLDRIVSGLWEFLAGAYHYFLLPVTSQMQALRGILYGRRMRTVISVGIQWNYITVTTTTTSECDGMPGMLY